MNNHTLSEILFISSYPPRECGIATYSQDLIKKLNTKFNHSFKLKICALESENEKHIYPDDVQYVLNTSDKKSYTELASSINNKASHKLVWIQHEFGFFKNHEEDFLHLINTIKVPICITFHTVLPNPDKKLKLLIQNIIAACNEIIVMTQSASQILKKDYKVSSQKISVIEHGTHLVQHLDKKILKQKYGFNKKIILSTFGLMGSGKNIETTLKALPAIIEKNSTILFLIIGKTHPTIVKQEGEVYRTMLEKKVIELKLENHVQFINHYLPLSNLLEYLQLTDIYLFTSKDPNQAVSGTFSYAISCGCPIISTPIPHAREVLRDDAGILIDFENSQQLSDAVNLLLDNKELRKNISSNGLHRIISTAWENIAIAHALIIEKLVDSEISLRYNLPTINLDHIKNLTTDFGMIQFSKVNHPDLNSGYTIDDNARAMVAMCMHYEKTCDPTSLIYIDRYFHFIKYCMQPNGNFLNYINSEKKFTKQNKETNLDDANGRAIWSLGYLIHNKNILSKNIVLLATNLIEKSLKHIEQIHSSRALGFALKGLYYYHSGFPSVENIRLAEKLANRLERMYVHESDVNWNWFESYLTYGNSILSEAMLYAYLITKNNVYKSIAKSSFDFLLSHTFTETKIKPISNRSWLQKGEIAASFGEQPIDVAYTILALDQFYNLFKEDSYLEKMEIAFNWFLGNNHLHQIIYNPCTGGCYDGLEETHINLNQGAESTVSYLMARLTIEKYKDHNYYSQQKANKQLVHSQIKYM